MLVGYNLQVVDEEGVQRHGLARFASPHLPAEDWVADGLPERPRATIGECEGFAFRDKGA